MFAVIMVTGRSGGEEAHSRRVFFFAAKKKARQLENKAGTKGAKYGENVWELGGREVQLRTTRPVPPFGGTAAGRNRTKYTVKYGIKRRNNTSKKWGKEGGTMHDKSRHM